MVSPLVFPDTFLKKIVVIFSSCRGRRPLVFFDPSGSGKSTLLKRLLEDYPNTFQFCVTHTTREPRDGEKDGIDHYFVTIDEMVKEMATGFFLETTVLNENIYGTSLLSVSKVQSNDKICILDIGQEGIEELKKAAYDPVLIFYNPPSIKRHLRKRRSESDETTINKRLASVETEIAYGLTPGNFHKVINNEDIDAAYEEFRDFIANMLVAEKSERSLCHCKFPRHLSNC